MTCCDVPTYTSFNRRGDSLGGAAFRVDLGNDASLVSIAGAILWGVLPDTRSPRPGYWGVSIAGAILWGVLPNPTVALFANGFVSIAGAILWGVLLRRPVHLSVPNLRVSIAGAILWGVLPV